VSLLKLLLTNYCVYDCLYCVNRRSSPVERARFTGDEVVRLTLEFYRRNYVEGLFLSSGIARSPDHTMEQLVEVARTLRVAHDFQGYIHLKTIPHASPELLAEAGRWADRLSVNVELPTQAALDRLAPEKQLVTIRRAMTDIRTGIDASRDERGPAPPATAAAPAPAARRFAPAGQSTQLIVGADGASDATILDASTTLYQAHRLRRVYYSAFSPIPDAPGALPSAAPPLVREHRLYQADWLVRFYGFAAKELTTPEQPDLDLLLDPKTAWALRHRALFPVDVATAPRELLLRVPGFRGAQRGAHPRGAAAPRLRLDDLRTLGRRRAARDAVRRRPAERAGAPGQETAEGCGRASWARARSGICSTGEMRGGGGREGARRRGRDCGGRAASRTRRPVSVRSGGAGRSSDRGHRGEGRMRGGGDQRGGGGAVRGVADGGARAAGRGRAARGGRVARGGGDGGAGVQLDALRRGGAAASRIPHPASRITPPRPIAAPRLAVPRRFLVLAAAVACHADPGRWALLYRALWRIAREAPRLLEDHADPDVARLARLERAVRREVHKCHAFVRFREVRDDAGAAYVAWFEPTHDVLARAAPFFARRFPNMRWRSSRRGARCAGRTARSSSARAWGATPRRRTTRSRGSGGRTTRTSSTRRG
jgi:putative DNA modification/repair radical SAM protein